MPIYGGWENPEQTILRFTFIAPQSWDEFYAMQNECAALCSGLDGMIDAVVDLTAGKTLPPNALTHLTRIAGKIPPDQGILVGIGVDTFFRSMADMVTSRYPHLARKLYSVKNSEEACAVIAKAQKSRNPTV